MRPVLVGILAMACASCVQAVDGLLQPLLWHGPDRDKVTLVILAEGYTSGEQDKFFADAQKALDGILTTEPYQSYQARLNVYGLFIPSVESGVSFPALGIQKNTLFGYYFPDRDRLLLPGPGAVERVLETMNIAVPEARYALVLVNTETYGGTAGGALANVAACSYVKGLAPHELGHALGLLADEYADAGSSAVSELGYPNASPTAVRANLKWNYWLEADATLPATTIEFRDGRWQNVYHVNEAMVWTHRFDYVAAFQGAAYSKGNFRPTEAALMARITDQPEDRDYGTVGREYITKQLHRYTRAWSGASPAAARYGYRRATQHFSVTCEGSRGQEAPVISWYVNGLRVAQDCTSVDLDLSQLPAGAGLRVSAGSFDPSSWVRYDPGHVLEDWLHWDLEPVGADEGSAGPTLVARSGIDQPLVAAATWPLPDGLVLAATGGGRTPAGHIMGLNPAGIPTLTKQLSNISARASVGTGDDVLIAGFIVQGDRRIRVCIRGLGPTLTNFGLPNVLPDPILRLYSGQTEIARNDSWESGLASADRQRMRQASLGDLSVNEPVLCAELAPGAYTAILSDAGTGTGVGLVEVYDLDQGDSRTTRLANVSARARVEAGDRVLIGGFIVTERTQVVIVGNGPSLAAFNVHQPLPAPTLTLYRGSTPLAHNDGWSQDPLQAALFNGRYQSFRPASSEDAGLIVTLEPGLYTAILDDRSHHGGVGLLAIYQSSDQ